MFSAGMARAGMSVPLPPRICEEPAMTCAPRVDDEVGCIAIAPSCPPSRTVLLQTYARAIVAARLPEGSSERAHELVAAWLKESEAFHALASRLERDFDARRAAQKARRASASARSRGSAPSADADRQEKVGGSSKDAKGGAPSTASFPGSSPDSSPESSSGSSSGSSTGPTEEMSAETSAEPSGETSAGPSGEASAEQAPDDASAQLADPSLDDIELFIEGGDMD